MNTEQILHTILGIRLKDAFTMQKILHFESSNPEIPNFYTVYRVYMNTVILISHNNNYSHLKQTAI